MASTVNLYQDPSGGWAGPKKRQAGRLFRYLGIQDPGDKRAFRMAAKGGELGQYFSGRPTSAKLFNDVINKQNSGYDESLGGRRGRRQDRLQQAASQFGYVGQFDPNNIAPYNPGVAENKPPVAPPTPGLPPDIGAPPVTPQSFEDMLARMGGNLGPTGQQYNSQISGLLQNGGLAPGFGNMYKNLLALHQQEGDRNIASLNTAFGARGNRYGSDILNAQNDMRRQQTNEMNVQGDQLAMQLGQQQQGLLGLGQQSAGMEQQAREAAANRMFQEYLARTSLPPIFQQMIGGLTGLPQNDTIAYTQGG